MSGHVDHLIVCGYRPSARMLLDALLAERVHEETPVVLIAPDERPVDLPPAFTWITGDPTKESELAKARVPHAGAVIVIGDRSLMPQQADATTLLTLFTIGGYMKKHGAAVGRARPLYMVAEILDAENVEHARAAGANEVIESTRLGFSLLAHAVAMPGTAALVSRVASTGANSVYVGRVPLPEAGETFGALSRRVKQAHGVLLLGIRHDGLDDVNPPDELRVLPGHELIYLAEGEVLPST